MSEKISRRGFLKLASVGAATTAVLTGCGPASRYVEREPYSRMPEYTYNGLSTYYATTCRECAAGCGLVVRTYQGRALKVEGNPNHPVNRGKTCPRGQITLQGLYNPDRVQGPIQHTRGEALYNDRFQAVPSNISWDDALQIVADALTNTGRTAFLMGTGSDHLFDLVSDLAAATGAPAPIRLGSLFEARATLSQAAESMFGQAGLPYFDIGNSDLVLSFGANFLETWLSPVAYSLAFSKMRRADPKHRGHLIQFEPRMSATASKADAWIPIVPGTEGMVALAIGRLVAESKGGTVPEAFANVDLEAVTSASGVTQETLEHIVQLVTDAAAPIAIPGGAALGMTNGLSTAQAIMGFNAIAENFGKPGGVFLSPLGPNQDPNGYHRPASAQELADFIESMNNGGVTKLFIHGVNPVFELPKSLRFAEALENVGTVISFATFPDETAVASDYILPDHHGLESWGYQRPATGSMQSALSGAQPVVSPLYNTRSTVDVFLAAAKLAGETSAQALPFNDEVEYLQSKLANLVGQADGSFAAPEINSFGAFFQQRGGWWRTSAAEAATASGAPDSGLTATQAEFAGEGEFFFLPFVSPTLGEAGANKPWLQELADPLTTVMWNTWVEINPETAHELGVENDDVVKIISEAGEVEAPVYLYPAIRPDVIAMPFGQGHTAYGRYAQGRGANPANLLSSHFNEAGDLAFAGMKVKVEKTGKKQVLSRLESRIGVYGEGLGEEGH